ncbi:C-8 sterol isomerase Erg2p [Trichomonascus vanleenenianus]|uniref:ERG2 family protein n=1 Tax=Trichomonascus vanleenenianus TaxID=2268995 RepID=UPI003ECAB3A7
MKFVGQLSIIFVALYFALSYVHENILPQFYVFDRTRLQQIGKEVISANPGANSTAILRGVHARLAEEYPGLINDFNEEDWVFNNAGNAMGSMLVLHASISEYLIFFGTATGTEGHTGTHFADDYFLILSGQQTAAPAHSREAEVYLPGDSHHLPCGYNKQYQMDPNSWALELAQGWIPTMLPFGLLETIFSTLDVWSCGKTIKISAVNTVKNLLRGKI